MTEQMLQAGIKGSSHVFLVIDPAAASQFYTHLGFTYEEIGGHIHVSRGNLTIILHPAKNKEDVRPMSTIEGGLYFDAFVYTDAVDLLVNECQAKGVPIVNGPNYSEHWNEFTIEDIDGYRIAFGGEVSRQF